MNIDNIMEFAGLFLQRHQYVSTPVLQKFIMKRIEVGRAIAPEDIDVALDKLSYAGFLELVQMNNEGYPTYQKDTKYRANL